MKAIYQGKLWHVMDDDGGGLFLERADGSLIHAPYDDPSLIVDPTDDEVELAAAGIDPAAGGAR